MESSSKSSGGVVVAAIVALLIGGGAGYAIGNSMQDDKSSDSSNSSMNKDGENKEGTTVGGVLMVKNLDVVDNAANAPNVSTTVSLVKMAGLVDVLKGQGPFTVFGPNNGAYEKLPQDVVAKLQTPEGKDQLSTILTYHVVPGTYTSADLRAMAGKGETLTTVQGGVLTPVVEGGQVKIKDAMGNTVNIETADIISSNGVTHVIDSVLMPKS